ncbi:POU domain, class 4, transcription factor 1-like [Monomorium pharaonis]|uniref:POU domain, class 4, transcription factor 1-like n=1 Tax=Monomorium pharaonis TaxID=307658 RepID=UPI00063F17CD|nr:POU domain, class 4, transcription factor 1-like [Monomorium pharaonis]
MRAGIGCVCTKIAAVPARIAKTAAGALCPAAHEGASPRVFVKRDGAGGGGANRDGGDGGGGGGGDGGGGDGSQGNDRKQLKGGESESRTSSTRQPHASSPPRASSPSSWAQGNTYTWDSWQAGDRRAPGSSTRTSLLSSGNRRIECRRRRAIPNDYQSCRSLRDAASGKG